MIKTQVEASDWMEIIELGRQFHQESHFRETPYDEEKISQILHASLAHPDKLFVAYDAEFRGLIFMQMGTQFFNQNKWAGDQAFYIQPEHRRSGLGKELLATAFRWAKYNGAIDFVISHNSGINREATTEFYKQMGFELSGLIFNKRIN